MTAEVKRFFTNLKAAQKDIRLIVYRFDGPRLKEPLLTHSPLREKVAECTSIENALACAIKFGERCFIVNLDDCTVSEVWADR